MARQLLADSASGRYVTFCVDDYGMVYLHAPGREYCRRCWPPRGRGRGETRYSIRRAQAVFRTVEALKLRIHGATYRQIALTLGYADKSVAWNAVHRALAEERRQARMRERFLTAEERALYEAALALDAEERRQARKRGRRADSDNSDTF